MILEKIEIKHFGMLSDTTLEFSDSMNVIEGHNEAGKSTIAAFIKYMLYGFEAEGVDGVGERQKRVQWQTGVAEGYMTVRVRGKRYLLYRSTVMTESGGRTVYKEDSSIIDTETGTPAFGKSPAGEVFFGADRALFENTAFLGTVDGGQIRAGTVREAIENILFSGSERVNSRRALEKLDDKMESLLHKSGVGGTISDLMRQKSALEETLRSSDEDNRRILEKEAELYDIRRTCSEAEERRLKLLELDSYYKNFMLIQTFDKLHELEQEAEDKAEAYRAFTESYTVDGFLPTEAYLADLRAARAELHETFDAKCAAASTHEQRRRAPGITREIEGAIAHADALGGERTVGERARKLRLGGIGLLTGTVLLALLSLFAVVAELAPLLSDPVGRLLLWIGGALALAGAVACLVLFFIGHGRLSRLSAEFGTQSYRDLLGKLSVITEVRERRDAMQRSIEDARMDEAEATRRYEAAKARLTELILRWGGELPERELDEFLDDLELRVDSFLREKEQKWDEKNLTELTVKEIRRTLSDKSEIDIRAGVSPLKRKALAEVNHDSIINGLAECKAIIAEQEAKIFRAESELDLLKNRAVDPTEVHTKMRRLTERIDALNLRYKAYELAYRTIENSSSSLRESISPRLGAFVTELMEQMTDRKYTSVDVSEGLRVTFTDATGEERSTDFLSDGTQDMVYMAVRMALIDMLYAEKPPLVFDETFAHQDNTRSHAMMRAIADLGARGYQSFIFTCRGREGITARELDAQAGIFKLSVVTDAVGD